MVINHYHVVYLISKVGAFDGMREGKDWFGNCNVKF